jgi:hypothetical protein
MDRYRFHGTRCVGLIRAPVIDCNSKVSRQDNAGAVDAGQFREQFRSTVDEIIALLRRPTRTLAQDTRAHYNALAELNRKHAAFWKGRTP